MNFNVELSHGILYVSVLAGVSTPCTPSPCKNGGTCKDGGGYATCNCAYGYFGIHCESKAKLFYDCLPVKYGYNSVLLYW